ncbi:MAG: glycosyltransferase [Deltaproteobacteria bacterium]|nr:glycosyltransferase [Deltaproteobacteria bacterium]
MRLLVAAFAEIPSLCFESEAVTELVKAFEGWFEVEVFTPMVEAGAHLEAFHGGRLHRVPLPQGTDAEAAAAAFRRGLERQVDSAEWGAVHVFSAIEGRPIADRLPAGVPLVFQPQPVPSLLLRLGLPGRGWAARLAADETVVLERTQALVLHEATDAGALRYRRRLTPHVVLPEPVDLDDYHWEQLVPGTAPVVLVLDPGLDDAARQAIDQALAAIPGPVVRWLDLRRARLQVEGRAEPLSLAAWFSGAADRPVPLRIAARAALNAADVVVVPHAAALDTAGGTTSCRRWGVLQAAACRRPVVLSEGPGAPAPSRLGEHLFRYPPGDWSAMADLVRSLLFHPTKAIQVAERARQRVESEFGAADFRRRLRAIYAGLVDREPGAPRAAPVRLEKPA